MIFFLRQGQKSSYYTEIQEELFLKEILLLISIECQKKNVENCTRLITAAMAASEDASINIEIRHALDDIYRIIAINCEENACNHSAPIDILTSFET